jgi:hypothetical protein
MGLSSKSENLGIMPPMVVVQWAKKNVFNE